MQFSSVNQPCLTLCNCSMPGFPCPSPTPGAYTNSCPLESVNPSNHLILCRPLLLLPSIFPSITVSFNESALHIRWPKVELQLQHRFFQYYSGLISFSIGWFDLLAVQGTLKSLVQHHDSKASILAVFLYLCMVSSSSWSLSYALKRPFHCTIRWCVVL